MRSRLPAVLALLLSLGTLAACSDDGEGEATDTNTSSSEAPGTTCSYPGSPAGAAKEVEPPPEEPAVSGQVEVTLATGVGDLAATLDADATPCTVNSFVSLAEQGYFDGTRCHRLTTAGIYVLQCGDPSGSGMGGPGFTFEDELTGSETYGAGTLAMANAGPDTNGSQFFIVYDDSQLDPNYTVFGQVDEASLELVADVAAQGTETGEPDGAPKQPVEIDAVSVG
jgi:peptidyl-prolyl cis-trans isomerase B (cyclophilin B)